MDARSLGGVPVLSRDTWKPSVSRVLARPMAGPSPILPAGLTSSPMLMLPRRNVPVASMTLLPETKVEQQFYVQWSLW